MLGDSQVKFSPPPGLKDNQARGLKRIDFKDRFFVFCRFRVESLGFGEGLRFRVSTWLGLLPPNSMVFVFGNHPKYLHS